MANESVVKTFSVQLFPDEPLIPVFLERILGDQLGKSSGPTDNILFAISSFIDVESFTQKVASLKKDHLSPREISLVDLFNYLYSDYRSVDQRKLPPGV